MMTLILGIKRCDVAAILFPKQGQLLLDKLSYPFTFCANLIKLAEIFLVTQNIEDFRTNFKTPKF